MHDNVPNVRTVIITNLTVRDKFRQPRQEIQTDWFSYDASLRPSDRTDQNAVTQRDVAGGRLLKWTLSSLSLTEHCRPGRVPNLQHHALPICMNWISGCTRQSLVLLHRLLWLTLNGISNPWKGCQHSGKAALRKS